MRKLFALLIIALSAIWASATACPTGYSNTISILIPARTLMAGDLSNYPLLFVGDARFAGTGSGGLSQLSTGADIVFCDAASGNLLPYKPVDNTYSTSTGAGEWWVRIPTLSASVTETIFALIGNASGTDHSDDAGVWTAYSGVWHFGTSSTLTLTDSTGNNTATNHGATATAAAINGGSAHASASSQWVDTGNLVAGLTNFTVEGWLNPTTSASMGLFSNRPTTGNKGIIFHDSSGIVGVCYQVDSTHFFCRYLPTGYNVGTAGPFIFMAGSHTGGSSNQVTLYYEGNSTTGTTSSANTVTDPADTSVTLQIGRDGASTTPLYYNGKLDEIRFAKSVLSADWIAADFAAQSGLQETYVTDALPATNIVTSSITPVGGHTCTTTTGLVSSTTTASCTLNNTSGAGNLNLFFVAWCQSSAGCNGTTFSTIRTTVSISDGNGTATCIPGARLDDDYAGGGSSLDHSTSLCYFNSIASNASNTVTVTTSPAVFNLLIYASEWTGQATSGLVLETNRNWKTPATATSIRATAYKNGVTAGFSFNVARANWGESIVLLKAASGNNLVLAMNESCTSINVTAGTGYTLLTNGTGVAKPGAVLEYAGYSPIRTPTRNYSTVY
jgi:hypothetical protein